MNCASRLKRAVNLQNLAAFKADGMHIAEYLMSDNSTIEALKAEQFDVILRDAFSWPTKLLSQMLHVPEVDIISAGVIQPFSEPFYFIPNPVAYFPQLATALSPSMVSIAKTQRKLQKWSAVALSRTTSAAMMTVHEWSITI